MKKFDRVIRYLIIFCFTGIAIFLSLNKHSKSGFFNYHSELWADRAGYYVYLPAFLKYGFNPAAFPDSIDYKTGRGFQLQLSEQKVHTKYTYGLALLQLPFYVAADALARPLGYKADGFSPIYHRSIDFAAIFYLIIGLLFLEAFLKKRFRSNVVYPVLILLFLGTNLYYYGISDTGMPHVYLFMLFSGYLLLLQKTRFLSDSGRGTFFLFGILAALILIIRPLSLIFLLSFFFLDLTSISDLKERFIIILKPNAFLWIMAGAVLVFLPQFVYWNYNFGTPFFYSYENEGFSWWQPHIFHVWFAPNNGLFLYNPVYFIILCILAYMTIKRRANGLFLFLMFLMLTYVLSCWWDWSFGCGFGGRNFVEYLSVFSLPIALLIQRIVSIKTKILKVLALFFAILLVVLNLKMIYSFDACFFGSGDWDWSAYFQLITSSVK